MDILKQIIGSVVSGIILLMLIFVFIEINQAFKENTDNQEAKEQLQKIEDNTLDSINWYLIIGGIADVLLLIGFIYFIFRDYFEPF